MAVLFISIIIIIEYTQSINPHFDHNDDQYPNPSAKPHPNTKLTVNPYTNLHP